MSDAGAGAGADVLARVEASFVAVDNATAGAAADAAAMPPPQQPAVVEEKEGENGDVVNAPPLAPQGVAPAVGAAEAEAEPVPMTTEVPVGVAPGQSFTVNVGGGRTVRVTCPADAVAGSSVRFLVPAAAAPPGAAAAPLAAHLVVPPGAQAAMVLVPTVVAAAAPRLITTHVPVGTFAGQTFTVNLQDGRRVQLTCPAGLGAGAEVQFLEPAIPAAAAAAAHQLGPGVPPPPHPALGQGQGGLPPPPPLGGAPGGLPERFFEQQQQQQQQQPQQQQQWGGPGLGRGPELNGGRQQQRHWPQQAHDPRTGAPPFGDGAHGLGAHALGGQHAHGQAHAVGQVGAREAFGAPFGAGGRGGFGGRGGGAPANEAILASLTSLRHLVAAQQDDAKDAGPVPELMSILGLPAREETPVHKIDETDFRCTGCTDRAGRPGGFGDCGQCRREANANPSIAPRFATWLKDRKAQPTFLPQLHTHAETRAALAALQEPSAYCGDYGDADTLHSANKKSLSKRIEKRVTKQKTAFATALKHFAASTGQKARAAAATRAIEDAAETNALNHVLKLCVSELETIGAELRQREGGGSSSSSSSSSSGGAHSSGGVGVADRIQFVSRNIKVVQALFHQGTLENELVVHRVLAREYFALQLPSVLGAARAMDMFEEAARGGGRTGPAGCADTPLVDQVRASIVERVRRMHLPPPSEEEVKNRDTAAASVAFRQLHDSRGSLLGKRKEVPLP
jgi:hypothetical protein